MGNYLEHQISFRRAILTPLVFYDQFSYPLTAWEIWRRLYQFQISLADVITFLDDDPWFQERITQHRGYYMLRGNETHVGTRQERGNISAKKYKKVSWFLKLLTFLPFIRFIAICNSLSYENSRDDSDIDLFIVAEKGEAHFVRMIVGFLAAIFRIRPKSDHGDPQNKNTICLSFFVDASSLDLKNLRLGNHDIYFHYWFLELFPIYSVEDYWEKLQEANAWIHAFFPNFKRKSLIKKSSLNNFLEVCLRLVLRPCVKKKLLALEEKQFAQALRSLANCDTRVIITPHILKLHPNDRREEYSQKFSARLSALQT